MGLITSQPFRLCCMSSNSKQTHISIDYKSNNIIKLQSHIRGHIFRSNHPLPSLKPNNPNLIQSSRLTNSNSFRKKIREISPTYSTESYDTNEVIIKLKKLLPEFKLNEKEEFILTTKNQEYRTVGLLYSDNSIYKGTININNKQREGYGTFYFKDGSIYIGFFKEDKIQGRGQLFNVNGFVYEGDFIDSKANGYGKLYDLNGLVYKGSWVNDKRNGIGQEINPDGSKYEGAFIDGRKEGKGKCTFKDGTTYEGDFVNDQIKGEGIKQSRDGRIYIGQWVNNKMDGYGIYVWPDKKKYSGHYCQDIKEGFGIFEWTSYKRFIGFWKEGFQHGFGVIEHDGNIFEYGEYFKGKLVRIFDDDENITFVNVEIEKAKNDEKYLEFIGKMDSYEDLIKSNK